MTKLTPVEQTILDHFHAPDDRHGSWWINPGEMAAAVETQIREQIAQEIKAHEGPPTMDLYLVYRNKAYAHAARIARGGN